MSARIDRRMLLGGAAAMAATAALPAFASTETGKPLHGLSAFGELKYPPDFTHFDYANPDAPVGGTFAFSPSNWAFNQNPLTFNTLNSFVPRGDAPPRMELCFDSLMVRSLDEPDAIYGLLAESVELSEDRNRFTFRLRPQARFHDGTPVTAADVAFTYRLFKDKGHPSLMLPLGALAEAREIDTHTIELVFTGEQSSRTILNVATYPIVSKAFFERYPFDSSELRPPLGSGRYRVGRVRAGASIEYERVADYWGADLPVNRGLGHFERIRIEFFRDRQADFEAFKKGDIYYRQEYTAKTWATEYNFPAVAEGKVILREFPAELRPSMQAWAINMRRERFRDRRVREAIALCFDFNWTRTNLFYGAYERSHSLFERSPYKAEGLPDEAELAVLRSLPGEVPEAAFGEAVMQPESDGSGRDRRLLGQAVRLLSEAGWVREGGLFRDPDGNPLRLEIMINAPVFERVLSPYVGNLRAAGIDAALKLVDAAQYQARQNEFDFDMISVAFSFGATPTGNELRQFFHSQSATIAGTRNLPGTADPAIDALIERIEQADNRQELEIGMRVLDRILRARLDWIPNWHLANHRAAYWDRFGFREPKPDYGFPVELLWWHDAEKAAAIGKA